MRRRCMQERVALFWDGGSWEIKSWKFKGAPRKSGLNKGLWMIMVVKKSLHKALFLADSHDKGCVLGSPNLKM